MALLGIVVWGRSTGQIDFIFRVLKKREKRFEEAAKESEI